MNKQEASDALCNRGFFFNWMSMAQRTVLRGLLGGEEGDYFVDMLTQLKARIEAMPKTYETEAIDCDDKIVHLHYFRGSVDAWVVEKDTGDGSSDTRQHQAFGKVTLYGETIHEAEWGYVSIQELIDNGVELDLHWEPRAVKEVK